MKKCLISIVILALFSCVKQPKDIEAIPNYFKHGMKGNIESVFTQTYYYKNGVKGEKYPKHFLFLWGDKFGMTWERKNFDKNGHLVEETTWHDWATYTDSTVVTYKYNGNHLVSSSTKYHTRKYTTPYEELFEYSENGDMLKWGGKLIKTNEDKQIEEIYTYFTFGATNSLECHRLEVFNNSGFMVAMYDKKTKDMEKLNTFDKNGNIIKAESFGSSPSTSHNDTIIYTKFDDLGNWTERLKIELDREHQDTLIQYRNIRYYDNDTN